MKRALIFCEESQAVTIAMRKRGIEAWSCDILPASGGFPEWHLQQDGIPLLSDNWDMIIAFPPCTDLCVSGAKHFKVKQADGRQQRAIEFFMAIANAPCERIAIENPVGIMSTRWRKPDQVIQPWMFGHYESKATCLWLRNLPLLKPTCILKPDKFNSKGRPIWDNQTASGQNKLPPSPQRAMLRSKTYAGIAEAMAEQWADFENVMPRQLSLFEKVG